MRHRTARCEGFGPDAGRRGIPAQLVGICAETVSGKLNVRRPVSAAPDEALGISAKVKEYVVQLDLCRCIFIRFQETGILCSQAISFVIEEETARPESYLPRWFTPETVLAIYPLSENLRPCSLDDLEAVTALREPRKPKISLGGVKPNRTESGNHVNKPQRYGLFRGPKS